MAAELNVPARFLNTNFNGSQVKSLQQYMKLITDNLSATDKSLQDQITALAARVTALEQAP